jgi:hypothetical protein
MKNSPYKNVCNFTPKSVYEIVSDELTVDEMSLGQMPFDGVSWCP